MKLTTEDLVDAAKTFFINAGAKREGVEEVTSENISQIQMKAAIEGDDELEEISKQIRELLEEVDGKKIRRER